MSRWVPIVDEYDALKCGSIDGTDTQVHDRAVQRAIQARYRPNKRLTGNARRTIFVGRLSLATTESTLRQLFSTFGEIVQVSLIRDIVTGFSKGYAFIEYKESRDAEQAYDEGNKLNVDGKCILVDYEFDRIMKGWVPRRLGGGFGGKKESGQLRFGCRDRPFKRPIIIRKDTERSFNTSYNSEYKRRNYSESKKRR